MDSVARAVAISVALTALFGCGGGGGGGNGPSFVEQPLAASSPAGTAANSGVPFASFDAVTANQTVVMDGVAVTASGTHTVAPNDDVTVNSVNFNPVGPGTAQLTYDASGKLKAVSISTPQSSAAFDRDMPDHSLSCSRGVVPACGALNPNAAAIAADPGALGWNYQTFGVWAVEAGATSWTAGAISVGAPTPASALPTTGVFTFSGAAAGAFVNSSGTPFLTGAEVNADVNFGTRNIAFSTSNTSTVNLNSGSTDTNVTSLNLSGTLSYAQGANSFSGQLTAGNGGMTGQGAGRFYGPAAQEMGGVYSLQGTAGRMLGGFGAKR